MSIVLTRTGAAEEIQKYTTDATDKLTAWINKANGRQSNLELAVDSQSTRTVLAGYTFDFGSEAFDRAWELAYNGDLVAALQTGAVTLDQGSGLEQEFRRKTSCSCNIFGLFKYNGWDEFSSNTSLVYAGHNTFHLVETVGHAAQSESVGALRSLNLYFTANAGVFGKGTLSNADIDLHLDLAAKGDRKASPRWLICLMRSEPHFWLATLLHSARIRSRALRNSTLDFTRCIRADQLQYRERWACRRCTQLAGLRRSCG